ncbi:conjugal transfer protein TraG N-terminal domain-containing protein [uncultured Sphingomonas sp.]|uniref:conjugal transfer protein TraG N-terminal domain-containing protein n=1 Tax=uncultured Sphingomonas sp. TaxID=158754 RepID=UPI002620407A|nr:conjugal transfer protein TraG N-terminal domain-containing protein [uncultured Sphingomonas sp.]
MPTLEVFTIGGGEYLVNVFNAVAAWCGGGGYRSLLQVVMVMGLAYSLCVVAFNLDWRAWMNWFIQSTLIYMMLMVPTVTVKVTDRIDPGLAPAAVDNVPLGLGVMASFTSQIGDWMTRTAETVFVMPNAVSLSNNGMIYGARLLEKARTFQITDAVFRANLDEQLKQCTFYDVLLGFKSMDDLTRSTNVWAAIGPGSPARSQRWITSTGPGTTEASIIPCNEAYSRLDSQFNAQIEKDILPFSKSTYPKLIDTVAAQKLKDDLPIVAGHMHGSATDPYTYLKQVSTIDAFLAARESFSDAGWDAYASQRADAQAKNTYTSIAQQAMTWVPLLGIVLTVVFYAMFPVLFPLFLFPRTGVSTLKGYAVGFFYLASWGPLYVILHMFVMSRAASAYHAIAPNGPTLLVSDGIDSVNVDISTLAGFLMMSVPFLAAGMAKGAMAIAGQATSMLMPAQNAAEQAATERTTGNYSYGNTSFQNLTSGMVQANKWDTAPQITGGFARQSFINDDGSSTGFMANGAMVYNTTGSISNLPQKFSVTEGAVSEMRQSAAAYHNQADQLRNSVGETWGAGHRNSHSHSSGTRAAFGGEGSSGTGAGSAVMQYDRNGTVVNNGTDQSRRIGQGVRSSEGQADNYAAVESSRWNLEGGLSLPALGGGRRGASRGGPNQQQGANQQPGQGGQQPEGRGSSSPAQAGIKGGYGYSMTDGTQYTNDTSNTRSDQDDVTRTAGVHGAHGNGRDVQVTDETYRRDGSFYRNETFSGDTTTSESFKEYSERINREAAKLDERGRRLEEAANYAETHGYTLNEDMSQYVASRYFELQHGSMSALNAPDIYRTNLTSDQREARDTIVRSAMRDFIDQPRELAAPRLVEPDIVSVTAPKPVTVGDLSGGVGRHVSGHGGRAGEQPARAARRAEIAEGAGVVRDEAASQDANYQGAVLGAQQLHDDQRTRTNTNWHAEHRGPRE